MSMEQQKQLQSASSQTPSEGACCSTIGYVGTLGGLIHCGTCPFLSCM